MSKQEIGVIGMAVMGRNLALNLANKQYTVSIFNRTQSVTENIIKCNKEKKIFGYFSIKEFIYSIKKPRCILLMVQSGRATDETIQSILPYLNQGDILIDGGNTFYQDTIRRNKDLIKYGINFIGMGVSGGEYGALNGPSIMPGGSKSAYELIAPILKKISAKFKGEPCVSYIGPNGAGHYVKMIHNGIEYGDMQLISESYFILKSLLNINNKELSDIFDNWNQGELNSYLIEITKNIFLKKEKNKTHYLIDSILDEAEDKGTGKWISKDALELREPLSLITESVFARYLSSLKDQRVLAAKILKGPTLKSISFENKENFIEEVRRALYLGKIISYAQGFSQLKKASEKYSWDLKYGEIAKIFRSGCIIRASFLEKITDAFQDNSVTNLLLTDYFSEISNQYEKSLRFVTIHAIKYGIPIPAFSSAITYYDSYRTVSSSANLIQAQRDYFGAHTYKRIDKKGYFHTNWLIKKEL